MKIFLQRKFRICGTCDNVLYLLLVLCMWETSWRIKTICKSVNGPTQNLSTKLHVQHVHKLCRWVGGIPMGRRTYIYHPYNVVLIKAGNLEHEA